MGVIALWSFAVFLASVFGGLLTGITLTPKYKGTIRAAVWAAAAAIGYLLAFVSYSINLYNDLTGILGLAALLCVTAQLLYKDSRSTKLAVSLMGCLIGNVSTFMFCGTTDSLLAPRLGIIRETPYEAGNILFFIGIKLVIYTLIAVLYARFLKNKIHATIMASGDNMILFVPPLAISVIGFYIINLVSNTAGIIPKHVLFFPLYLTICVIFIVEFLMIFYSINQRSKAMKTEAELSVAANIQQSMLPCIFPAFPERAEFDIYATMTPAKEVGGDFYDFFLVDEDHLAMVMADVSGKGVPAALFMMISKTLIKNAAQSGLSPKEALEKVNDQLCENNEAGLFVTVWLGILEISTGKMKCVNAGHEYPAIKRRGESFSLLQDRHGFVLAGMEGAKYREYELELAGGDSLFVYTDGVAEATNANQELYGTARMVEALNRKKDISCKELLGLIHQDVDAFVGEASQFDDITMLCLEYKGKTKAERHGTGRGLRDEGTDN